MEFTIDLKPIGKLSIRFIADYDAWAFHARLTQISLDMMLF